MLLQFEKKNNYKAIERFCSIGLLQQTITWYMVVGKPIIIPGHEINFFGKEPSGS